MAAFAAVAAAASVANSNTSTPITFQNTPTTRIGVCKNLEKLLSAEKTN
jgi:hypothetical protein